jgi:hypothetical protein
VSEGELEINRTACLTTPVIALVISVTGCGRVAQEAVGTVRGAKGTYVQIKPERSRDPNLLSQYTRFELGRIDDAFGGKVPGEILSRLPIEFDKQLEAAKLLGMSGGKTLLVRGNIYHYEDEGMVGTVLGPLEEVVARIELVDKDTGRVIAVANCIGRTEQAINKGPAKKAEGLAKAIVGWIKHNYPKVQNNR